MKPTLITIALAALMLQSAIAAPQPSIDFGAIGQEILNGLQGIVNSSASAAQDFVQIVQDGSQAIQAETAQFGQDVSNIIQQGVSDLSATVASFSANLQAQLGNVRNLIKRALLQQVQQQLVQLNQTTTQLEGQVDLVRQHWEEDIQTTQTSIVQAWNVWADAEVDAVAAATNNNPAKVNEAEHLVDGLVKSYSDRLANCVDEADDQLDAYESSVQNTIEGGKAVVQSVLEQVQACLQSSDSAASALQCQSGLRQPLQKLTSLGGALYRLNVQGASLLVNRFSSNVCVIRTVAQFELAKIGAQQQINEIILSDDAETTTAAAGDSVESTSAAPSG